MIVYTGKQRGNDFNNGDEALFQDAGRPRDNNKFKIKPGLQSDKWDFRETNKNVNIKANELKAHGTISGAYGTVYKYPPSLTQDEKIGDPGCVITEDGKIQIVEDGTYIIQASCQFKFNSTPGSGQLYVENIALLKKKTDGDGFVIQTKNQGRVCAKTSELYDQLTAIYTGWVAKGTIFTVGACQDYGNSIVLNEIISVQRLA